MASQIRIRGPLSLIRSSYSSAISESSVQRLCTSWLLPNWAFLTFRLLISLYCFIVLFYTIGYRSGIGEQEAVEQSFSYFTVLGYWGLAFYYAFAGLQTGSMLVSGRGRSWVMSWPGPLRWLFAVYGATVTVFPWVVTAVFWAVLSANAFESTFSTFTNISEHALNSVFAPLEIILARSNPHPWINLPILIVILALYLGLAYLTHDTEGIYVYDFLDPKNGKGAVAGYCFAILAATIVVFVIVRYLQLLRRWLTEDRPARKAARQSRDSERVDESALEMGIAEKPKNSKDVVNSTDRDMPLSKEAQAKGFEA